VNIAVAKVWFVEITDGLIQAVMYCGQDKNKKTILISDVSLEELRFYMIFSKIESVGTHLFGHALPGETVGSRDFGRLPS